MKRNVKDGQSLLLLEPVVEWWDQLAFIGFYIDLDEYSLRFNVDSPLIQQSWKVITSYFPTTDSIRCQLVRDATHGITWISLHFHYSRILGCTHTSRDDSDWQLWIQSHIGFQGRIGHRIRFNSIRTARQLRMIQHGRSNPTSKINHNGFVRHVFLKNGKRVGLPVQMTINFVPKSFDYAFLVHCNFAQWRDSYVGSILTR
mmetsp:Transcript_28912/g.69761  ORF Transcript_28912/g.69761 Transcript_28912/m.69761 type:complete len:201 (+) Transcript_28912:350-952(+)